MTVGVHAMAGWVTVVVVLLAGLHARSQVRTGREYRGGLHRGAAVLVDIQVLIGLLVWADDRWWEVEGQFAQTWLHPGIALATLAVVHIGVKRARDERWAAEAYKIASRALLAAAVLLVGAGALAAAA